MNRKGFTLIETLISLSLLLTVAVSFFYLSKIGARLEKEAKAKLKAAYAYQAKMEEAKSK
ncbi:hypothetical protein A2276_00395 [candidate division WOR-1 bacterium RIFOXYA12_FULL_43_27]|uniref:Prepilin-type N-terminal cleavage/methylation domain-containing protein n=1 Tax=candidate division WOR-1 bacterium RIFOXYC2_FULL_46_14 TaxID=1802587 RepID=A0A1F4U4C9_UNCSA|nr:MAG: hypothetical protein A2276_00395 [candidate division WOR-1 bacterium RIFOXYA12_FULL_43_27]OGC20845.1 MAG: hypothetical protein A2292_07480 [candidate division WOR-1 bacterium RIFOXYB2_FULL_46_45]OGC31418.1 MAG: hypothetical protein A2232_03970 [candidate division WOR-1 bacterium RIFOXYA2_FULL_46_56]OGC39824.1 MAG: hypothetical protein A2438_04805 [candidate division WOR-1 bacterium RIFOXYC2_FULL_46_14]